MNPKSLKKYNTFGIDAQAQDFIEISQVDQLQTVLTQLTPEDIFVLGGGSNMLLCSDIEKTVLYINNKGIRELDRTPDEITLEFKAGENWHESVMYCVEQGYGGIENLALIPGKIGAAPIQNIGAYGVELKDVFVHCEAVEVSSGALKKFDLTACKFGYRDSVFKNELKGKFIITAVALRLSAKNHKYNTTYGAIEQQLATQGAQSPSLEAIAQAVISIRSSKLPDPSKIGNSGSFFKNPVVNKQQFDAFRAQFPAAPFYTVDDQHYKIPAGWLIEKAGFKGKRYGDAGVHDKQALVLVNHGEAKGAEIWNLAKKIKREVALKFGITLNAEVNLIGCQ